MSRIVIVILTYRRHTLADLKMYHVQFQAYV
jgi:hypothetical protein